MVSRCYSCVKWNGAWSVAATVVLNGTVHGQSLLQLC